ncbi:MAG: TMEM175 family protein [Ktedonobacterales bacterium]
MSEIPKSDDLLQNSMQRVATGQAEDDGAEEKDTGRVEAFSDGVFAIAITLLVLFIQPPTKNTGGLLLALAHEWTSYAAYAVSFLLILVMWINHHNLFKVIMRVDNIFLLLNGLLLMVITFVDFPTSLLAQYINSPDGRWIMAFYSAIFTLISLLYQAVWWYAIHHNRLIRANADRQAIAKTTRQYRFGPLVYVLALALAFVSPWASLILNATLAVYFAGTGSSLLTAVRR